MQQKKIALITGANAGMGKATAIALARAGFFVVMLCRSQARGEAALAEVTAESGSDAVRLMRCDLGSLADVQRFCTEYTAAYGALDVLVNNAGVLSPKRKETADGLELHFGVCHIAHFLLATSLAPLMRSEGKVITISSVAHKIGRIAFDDVNLRRRYSVIRAYSQAKLCNVLFTKEIARRLAKAGVSAYCVHPGAVITGIGATRTGDTNDISLFRKLAGGALRFLVKTPEQGAATAIALATNAIPGAISGGYYANCKPAKPSAKADDKALCQRLWTLSEATVMDILSRK